MYERMVLVSETEMVLANQKALLKIWFLDLFRFVLEIFHLPLISNFKSTVSVMSSYIFLTMCLSEFVDVLSLTFPLISKWGGVQRWVLVSGTSNKGIGENIGR